MVLFGVDVASYQGEVNWPRVRRAGISFGFSKVTEGTGYVNPTWAHNRRGMIALGAEFVPGAYHFLRSDSDPAAQARAFLRAAGDVSRLAVALDVEPTTGSRPTAAQARAWVSEFKARTGGHPVIGYYPRWWWSQTGTPDLRFFDTIWQSAYVSGTGTASQLYARVPGSWWTQFGGEPISILQFSSSASVSGIAGRCDVNAYRGTRAQLRALALGIEEDDVEPEEVWRYSISRPDYAADVIAQSSLNAGAWLRTAAIQSWRARLAAEANRIAIAEMAQALAAAAADRGQTIDADALVARITSAIDRLNPDDEET